jgi:hypothetical protein
MQWTVRQYLHQAENWKTRTEHGGEPGAMAYAHRKVVMWTEAARTADAQFKRINSAYQCLVEKQ